ncbi:Precorrin-3B C17-methyltransferase [gamma proteobacterium HdN1]|nr:Precorrin-3B C17-methyltransferase [gamma proteobacterium HdN1]
MNGRLTVVGIGPGNLQQITPEVSFALEAATDVFGYEPYLARLPEIAEQVRHASDNREELQRAGAALAMAAAGKRVVMVSGGDAGVFAMAAAVCEAVEVGPALWREVALDFLPGVTAMTAVAARVGAPLGHDFCAISLSDNLKPWSLIVSRLRAAATAGFVIALYNPISRARPTQLDLAFDLLREILPASTPVIFGQAVGRASEKIDIAELAQAQGGMANMATCVLIGSPRTRIVVRPGREPLVYSPRAEPEAK